MRDAADQRTAEIPGVELPRQFDAPQRLTEQQRRDAQGYAGPKQRGGCWNCRHFTYRVQMPDTVHERKVAFCGRGNFRCDKSGFCEFYSMDTRRQREADIKR
jgi:hypothetical protein